MVQDRQYRGKHPHPQGSNQAGINDDGEFFSNVTTVGNLCDDEKLRPSLEEEGDDKNNDTTTGFNGDRNDDDDGDDDEDDDSGFKKQLSMETFRGGAPPRKKEVTFAGSVPVAEVGGPGSPMSHTYGNSGGGSLGMSGMMSAAGAAAAAAAAAAGEKGEFMKHPHALLNRQVRREGGREGGRGM